MSNPKLLILSSARRRFRCGNCLELAKKGVKDIVVLEKKTVCSGAAGAAVPVSECSGALSKTVFWQNVR